MDNEKLMKELDWKIRNTAIRASRDNGYGGEVDISWAKEENKIFVYLEFLSTDEYAYRIFLAEDYDKKLIFEPSYEDGASYRCLYDHVETKTGETKTLYIDPSLMEGSRE